MGEVIPFSSCNRRASDLSQARIEKLLAFPATPSHLLHQRPSSDRRLNQGLPLVCLIILAVSGLASIAFAMHLCGQPGYSARANLTPAAFSQF